MGQEIVYCFQCRSRLVSADFEKRAAWRIGPKISCKACLPTLLNSPQEEERKTAEAALSAPRETPRMPTPALTGSSTVIRIAAVSPKSSGRPTLWMAGGIAAAGIVTILLALPSGKPAPRDHDVSRTEPVIVPSAHSDPAPKPPERVVPPPIRSTEGEKRLDRDFKERAAALLTLREAMNIPYQAEEFGRALEILEKAGADRADAEWTSEVARMKIEVRSTADRMYRALKEKAVESVAKGDPAEEVARLSKWGLPDLVEDLAKSLTALKPATPAPSPDAVPPPEALAYISRWEKAAALAAGRDYPAAIQELEGALASTREPAVRKEAEDDLAWFKLASSVPTEAFAALSKVPLGEKLKLESFAQSGNRKVDEGTLARIDAVSVILKSGSSTHSLELGELTPGSLVLLFLERKNRKPQTDARAAGAFCLLEKDVEEGIRQLDPGLVPPKYVAFARRPMGLEESRARQAFMAAEEQFHTYSTRFDAILRFKAILKDYAETAFVRRNRGMLAGRIDSGKEYFFFSSQLTGGGTFKLSAETKGDPYWVSGADTAKERLKDNFVQLSFSALPDLAYRCWIYAGGCCGETFAFSFQSVEGAGTGDDLPSPVRVLVSLPARTHAAHGGLKQPARWGWVAVPLPKFGSPGAKKIRLLTIQQGFAVQYAFVSAVRHSAPTEAEIKKMDRPSTETPLNAGLEAYWKFDEGKGTKVQDSSGKGLDGSFVRNVQWGEGKFSGGVRFERDNYVLVPHTDALSFHAGDSFSISLWVNVPSTGGGSRAIFAKSREAAPYYGLWISNGKWLFGGSEKTFDGGAANPGWHHLVLVQNGATRERLVYVDGAKTGSGPAQEASGTGELRIGAAKGVSEYLTGMVDELRVYSRALNPLEIALLGQAP